MAKPRDLDVSGPMIAAALATLTPLVKSAPRIERVAFDLLYQAAERLERWTKDNTDTNRRLTYAHAMSAAVLIDSALHAEGKHTAFSQSVEALAMAIERACDGRHNGIAGLCATVSALLAQDRELNALLAAREPVLLDC